MPESGILSKTIIVEKEHGLQQACGMEYVEYFIANETYRKRIPRGKGLG